MLYVKAIFGKIYHKAFALAEGEIAEIEDYLAKTVELKKHEEAGVIKIFENYEEAVAFKFKGYKELALQSLPFLNPPLDEDGKSTLTGFPTMDISTGLPIKKEYNYR